ncbi:MAG: type II toxin-antitoxin system VapC family toxin [Candidatus Acidiferrum sp.]
MKYLLDTSVFLWGLSGEDKLNPRAQEVLTSSSSELHFSAAGAWEIAIKYALGALPLPKAPWEFVPHAMRSWPVQALDITQEHALRAGALPMHHRDPFDRMLIAQTLVEGMTLLTADRAFQKYKVDLIFCGK